MIEEKKLEAGEETKKGKLDGATVFMTVDDGSLPTRPGESVKDVLKERALFELDVYYPWLSPFTMRTEFVAITVEEVQSWRRWNRGAELSTEELCCVAGLRDRLHTAIELFKPSLQQQAQHPLDKTWGAFVRLSTRSPKDAVDKMEEQLLPRLKREMHALAVAGSSSEEGKKKTKPMKAGLAALTADERMLALRRAFLRMMQVQTGDEALQLMMRSHRTVSDLKRAIDFLAKAPEWKMKLIVREFSFLDPSHEFRGFVYGKKLTALSQYFCDSCFPSVASNAEAIADRARAFFDKCIAPILPDTHADCILDLVVDGVGESSLWVVELNPYSTRTGPCLFDWQRDAQVLKGEKPFEFRFVKPGQSQAKHSLLPWQHLFAKLSV